MNRNEFDSMIGRLDRALSEIMIASERFETLDPADIQTLKHHADDLINMGNAIAERARRK